jgi:hypothetical protein
MLALFWPVMAQEGSMRPVAIAHIRCVDKQRLTGQPRLYR